MPVELNHTLVHAADPWVAAREVAATLGLVEPAAFGPFAVVSLDNGASLDFVASSGPVTSQHYAFLVDEDEFDAIWGRLRDRDVQWWADPHRHRPGEINHHDGGRGLYWAGPDGHWLEVITRPYGSDGAPA